MRTPHLDKLSDPRSIAVVGTSATEGRINYGLVENLIEGRRPFSIFYPLKEKSEVL
jgi:acyl-CoA synthetase (NDP forming)